MTLYSQDLRQVEIQCSINQHNDVITSQRATGTGRSAAIANRQVSLRSNDDLRHKSRLITTHFTLHEVRASVMNTTYWSCVYSVLRTTDFVYTDISVTL